MKNTVLTGIVPSAAAIASLTVVSSFSPAEAASFSFNSTNFTGSNAKVNITLDDQAAGAGKVQFTVKMAADSPSVGDLRGVFFNIANNALLSGLRFTGANVETTATSSNGGLSTVGNVNLNGDGGNHTFEVGVEIGENGLKGGKDDIQSTTFVLSHTSQKLDLSLFSQQDFGIRMTSVGAVGSSRSGSSKLVGTSPLPPISLSPSPFPNIDSPCPNGSGHSPAPAASPCPNSSASPSPAPAPSPVVTTPAPAPVPAPSPVVTTPAPAPVPAPSPVVTPTPAPVPAPSPVVTTPAPAPVPAPSPVVVLPPLDIPPVQNPVVITPPPSEGPVSSPFHSNQPTEIPEPGTITALLLASAGAFKFLKQKNEAQA